MELHRLGGIYVGNDFQRLMARAEVENFFFFLVEGERRGEGECMAAEEGEGADEKEP